MVSPKQVDKSHYEFRRYFSKARWNSVWHQLDEVIRLKPERVLEIGPGPGLFKTAANLFGIAVETVDVDPELKPDHVASATELPFPDSSFDIVCAFQVLEHLPYQVALSAFKEMVRVSNAHIIVSLPDAKPAWRYLFYIPKIGYFNFLLPRPFTRPKKHCFDGEHHWEINKRDYPLQMVMRDLSETAKIRRTFRVKENSYHRFFAFMTKDKLTP